MALFFVLLVTSSLCATWNIGLDCRAIDSLWSESMRFDIEGGYRYKDIRISALFSFGLSDINELAYFDGGLSVAVYPFDNFGFFIGCTVFKLGKLLGLAAPDEDILFSSEAYIGWTISLPYVYIEPRLAFSDTLSSETSVLTLLRESITQYSRFRLSLLVGVGI